MAYAVTSASGECSAQWFAHVDRVVLGIGHPSMSVHLTSGEAWALAAQLIAAADQAENVDVTAA